MSRQRSSGRAPGLAASGWLRGVAHKPTLNRVDQLAQDRRPGPPPHWAGRRLAALFHLSSRDPDLVKTSARWPGPADGVAPVSFCVLGFGDVVHWASLALMESLRARGYRTTGLLPLAGDAQWRHGRWRSERVAQLQRASSYAFPASALCTTALPEPHDAPAGAVDVEAVVDSHAVLATWVDIVVVDALGDPDGDPAPNMGDVAQALGLPVVIACADGEGGDGGLQQACQFVSRLRARGLRVAAWVQSARQPLACVAGIPCVGAIPPGELHEPVRAARHVDVTRLLGALQASADPAVAAVSATARKTGGPAS